MQMKKRIWLVFAVSHLTLVFILFFIQSLFSPLDINRIQTDAALGNSPLWFGGNSINCVSFFFFHLAKFVNLLEWALSTQFSATDEFIKKWADAQKYVYGMGAGWIVSYIFYPSIKNRLTI